MTINEKFLEVTHFHPPYFLQLVIELLENTSDEQALSDNSVFTGIFINSEGKSIGKMDYNKVKRQL